jgi:hypothetical protein
VGVHHYHALTCIAVLHGDRHRIPVVADFLAGKVAHEDGFPSQLPLLSMIGASLSVGIFDVGPFDEEDESPFVGLLQVEAA